jgi:hypothetical protein
MNPDESTPPRKRKRGGNRKKGMCRAETLRDRVKNGTNRFRSVGHKPLPEDDNPAHLVHHARPYLHYLTTRNFSPATVERRGQALRRFLEWTLERGILRADEITLPVIAAYQAWSTPSAANSTSCKPTSVGLCANASSSPIPPANSNCHARKLAFRPTHLA